MGKQPNLLYVFADQLGYFSCGYAGDEKAKTPNIDAFSRDSVNFCNAVSGHPVCAPYRASLFTGKYTTSTGMVINEIRMNPHHRCFAHVLNDGGYETAYIGKWHMYANELGNHFDPKNSYIPKGEDRLGFDGFFAAYNFHHDYYGDHAYYHLDSPEKIYADGYEPDVQTDMAVAKLKELSAGEKPFALFLSLGTPHDPWVPGNVPPEYLAKFQDTEFTLPPNYAPENDPHADNWAKFFRNEREELTEWMRVYYAMVANLDDNVGRILQAVEDLGLREDTIVVFTSDHGEMFGAHGRRAKNIFYEEAVRVPFLLRCGGKTEAGSRCGACLNTVDIMPTLLGLMDLPVPEEAEGADLSPLVFGLPCAAEPEFAMMMCTGATADWGDGYEWRAIRSKEYTYAKYLSDGQELLFHNLSDPYQTENLAVEPGYAEVLADCRRKMAVKMGEISDAFHPCSYYKTHWVSPDRIILKTATLNADKTLEELMR